MKHRNTCRSAVRNVCGTVLILALCAAFATAARAQDRLAKYRAQYQQQTDLVRKAKLLGQMGPLEVDLARASFKAGDDEQALDILTRYAGEAQKITEALMATGADAVRRPAGFKELQIGLRVSLGRLDDLILTIPVDKRPWFRSVRSDLADLQNTLIDALFRSPDKRVNSASGGN